MGSVAVRGFAPAIFFVLLGGLLWGWIGATGRNPLSAIVGKRIWIVYILVGLAAVFVAWQGRNAFLPFLGPTVFPCAALNEQIPEGANTNVRIQTRPGAKVLYWAAEPTADSVLGKLQGWRDAYGGFENVGVALADVHGVATLRIRGPPQSYTVPMKGELKPHVHYRVCLADGGLAQVETVFWNEGFQSSEPEQTKPEYSQVLMPSSPETTDMSLVGPSDEELLGNTSVPEEEEAPPQEDIPPPPPMEPFQDSHHNGSSLQTIRTSILKETEHVLFDPFAFPEGDRIEGSDLESAFAEPLRSANRVQQYA